MTEYLEIKKSRLIYWALVILLSLGLNKDLSGQQTYECSKKIAKIYQLPSSIAYDWQTDKNGCKKLRSKYTDTISKIKNQLFGMNIDIFKMVFGKPDYEDEGGENVIVYYFNLPTECVNGKPSKKSDNSRLFFSFRNKVLFDIGHQIE